MLQELFPSYVLLAFIGAMIGGSCAANPREYGWFLSIMFVLVGMIAAAAITDVIGSTRWIWYHALMGVGIGAIAGSFMDAIKAYSPQYADKIVNAVGKKAVGKIDDLD